MTAGETFLLPGLDDHLWMVISDPAKAPDQLVVVCFLSWQPQYDQACVLEAGDHPFIKHSTCVNYPGARVVSEAKLESLKARGAFRTKDPLSTQLLTRIRASAANADIPTECYDILRRQGFVP
jgi:hypothetical protein